MDVDYVKWPYNVSTNVKYGKKYSIIEMNVAADLYLNDSVEINFRLHRKQWNMWDCSRDFSYQEKESVKEENLHMTVNDSSGEFLWGIDPVSLRKDREHVYLNTRGKNYIISRYDDDESEMIYAGRFLIVKDVPLSFDERKVFDSIGVKVLDAVRFQEKNIYTLRVSYDLQKKILQNKLVGFFNAVEIDELTPLSLSIRSDDAYVKTEMCNEVDLSTTHF